MGGLDYGYVSAVLSLTPIEIDRLDVNETFLADEGARKAMGFVRTYIHETGKVPPAQLVTERFPEVDPTEETDIKWISKRLRERKVFQIAKRGLTEATRNLGNGSVDDMLITLEQVQRNIIAARETMNIRDLQELGPDLRQFYLDMKAGKMGIETPWRTLNMMTRGLWPETVTFFAARPGVGKTFLAIIICRYAHLGGKRVLIISPEMNAMEIGERHFAIGAKVPYSDVISGSLSEMKGVDGLSAEDRYFKALDEPVGPGPGPYIIDDEERLTPGPLEASIAVIQPDLIGIDAAYLLRIGKGSRYERIIEVVEWMRYVSKKFHVPIVATSQLTKEAEKKGVLGQLTVALSDTINWDAHNLFALKQTPEMRADGKLNIVPIKVRRMARAYGKSEIEIQWNMEHMLFDEIESDVEFKDEGFGDDHGGKFTDDDMPF